LYWVKGRIGKGRDRGKETDMGKKKGWKGKGRWGMVEVRLGLGRRRVREGRAWKGERVTRLTIHQCWQVCK